MAAAYGHTSLNSHIDATIPTSIRVPPHPPQVPPRPRLSPSSMPPFPPRSPSPRSPSCCSFSAYKRDLGLVCIDEDSAELLDGDDEVLVADLAELLNLDLRGMLQVLGAPVGHTWMLQVGDWCVASKAIHGVSGGHRPRHCEVCRAEKMTKLRFLRCLWLRWRVEEQEQDGVTVSAEREVGVLKLGGEDGGLLGGSIVLEELLLLT